MKIIYIYLYIFAVLLFSSCAIKVSPTGGPKDVTPPKLKKATPENLGVNFSSKKIELTFDEYVQLNDVENQLIISPLIFPKPQVKAYKKSVFIILPDSLHPNTTYTINFGKSIADVHEKNIFEGYQYVFSTGGVLDSLTCKGKVFDAATMQPLKALTVMLYRDSDGVVLDSAIFKKRPEYFTKTDDQGNFIIKNIAANSYSIYSLEDKNNNYICDDVKEETMSFSNEKMTIPQAAPINLYASKQEAAKLKLLKSSKVDRLKSLIVYSNSVKQLTIQDLKTHLPYAGKTEWTNNHDSLFIFLPDTLSDSLNISLMDGNTLKDTVVMQMSSFNTNKIQPMPKLKFTVAQTPFFSGPSAAFILESDRPVSTVGDNFTLMMDSTVQKNVSFKTDSANARRIILTAKWKEGSTYKLLIPSGAIKDLYNLANDTLKFNITIPTSENTGILTVKVDNLKNGSNYILQLTDEKFNIVRQQLITENGSYTFNYLQPNKFNIRLVEDKNKNGKWDGPSYGIGQQPESVSTSAATLQVRANWEMETEILAPK